MYFIEGENAKEEEIEVDINDGCWDVDKLKENISGNLVEYVADIIRPLNHELNDKAVWLGNSSGVFSAKSAFRILRKRKNMVQ